MILTKEQIDNLETPCLVIDVAQAEMNIKHMQEQADKYGCALRPHIKTHKMKLFAQKQISYGANGITCAKVSEAEVMADGGIDDIFIAYPMVGDFRIKRAVSLARRMKRLILAIDSLEGAQMLNNYAEKEDIVLEVRLEVDTGAKRTGTLRQNAVSLAKEVSRLSFLKLTGVYTFKSLVYNGKATDDNILAAEEEGVLMSKIAEDIQNAGIPIQDISAGSTPTGIYVAATGKVNEIRPGTYIFKDFMLLKEKVAEPEEIAARYYATVVSTPSPEYAILDGGTKNFPTDVPIGVPPMNYPGYAVVEGNDNLLLSRMNEEHGILTAVDGNTGLQVGQKLALIPIHICTAVNMQNEIYLLEDGTIIRQKVDARGMLV